MKYNIRYQVIKRYKSPYPKPIVFKKGERVNVGGKSDHDPDWKDWYWCSGEYDQKAWVPKQFLKIDGGKGNFIQDYDAKELNVQAGEILRVYEIVNGFAMAENEECKKGWVPLNHLDLLD